MVVEQPREAVRVARMFCARFDMTECFSTGQSVSRLNRETSLEASRAHACQLHRQQSCEALLVHGSSADSILRTAPEDIPVLIPHSSRQWDMVIEHSVSPSLSLHSRGVVCLRKCERQCNYTEHASGPATSSPILCLWLTGCLISNGGSHGISVPSFVLTFFVV